MNFQMNGMEKIVADFHGMLKDSIKKLQSCDDGSKVEEKRKCCTLPKGKGKEKVFDEPSSSKPKIKGNFVPSPDEECFHWHKKGH
jgi:hypothetical protein